MPNSSCMFLAMALNAHGSLHKLIMSDRFTIRLMLFKMLRLKSRKRRFIPDSVLSGESLQHKVNPAHPFTAIHFFCMYLLIYIYVYNLIIVLCVG